MKNVILLVTLALIFSLVSGVLYIKYIPKEKAEPFITTFEECIQQKDSVILETFPRQCKSSAKRIYIEQITKTPDISQWEEISLITGVSFRCPPSWDCKTDQPSAAYISENQTYKISIGFWVITKQNFSKSRIYHPTYQHPAAWLRDVLAKKTTALDAPDAAVISREGSDERIYPRYVYYDLDSLRTTKFGNNEAIQIDARENSGSDTYFFLDEERLLLITLPLAGENKPIYRAILSSITY